MTSRAELENPNAVMTEWSKSFGLVEEGITACDIDGACERNGKFLILESKAPNEKPKGKGQLFMLNRLSRMDDFTVFFVFMEDKSSGIVDSFYHLDNGVAGEMKFGHDRWQRWVKSWWENVANG